VTAPGESRRRGRSPRPGTVLVLLGLGVVVGSVGGTGSARAQQPPPPEATADEFRATADRVLAGREFQRPEPTILERVRDWLGDRLDSLIDGLTGGGAGSLVGWVVLVLATAALLWSLTRLGATVRPDPSAAATVRIDQGRSPGEWRDEADRLEQGGAWKEALRCHYRALLGDLVRAGVIEDVPGRTTGEYRREVERALPGAGPSMREATELFEWAWYGDRPTGPEESARFRVAVDRTVAVSSEPAGRVDRAPVAVG
jgi:hypothetical protein